MYSKYKSPKRIFYKKGYMNKNFIEKGLLTKGDMHLILEEKYFFLSISCKFLALQVTNHRKLQEPDYEADYIQSLKNL